MDDNSSGIFMAMIAGLGAFVFVLFVVWLLSTIGLWKIYSKANKPGWHSLIPGLNLYTLVELVGLPVVWFWYLMISIVIGMFTAGVGLVLTVVISFFVFRELRRAFGQSDDVVSMVIFLVFSTITLPMLGLGSAQYRGPQTSADVPKLPWIS